jgi:hypothetical protein
VNGVFGIMFKQLSAEAVFFRRTFGDEAWSQQQRVLVFLSGKPPVSCLCRPYLLCYVFPDFDINVNGYGYVLDSVDVLDILL